MRYPLEFQSNNQKAFISRVLSESPGNNDVTRLDPWFELLCSHLTLKICKTSGRLPVLAVAKRATWLREWNQCSDKPLCLSSNLTNPCQKGFSSPASSLVQQYLANNQPWIGHRAAALLPDAIRGLTFGSKDDCRRCSNQSTSYELWPLTVSMVHTLFKITLDNFPGQIGAKISGPLKVLDGSLDFSRKLGWFFGKMLNFAPKSWSF